MTQALYAFSADPIHYGHIDLIERAAKAFDHVTCAIGVNGAKNPTFTLEERLDMARKSLQHLSNATVTSFDGLLVDYAYEQQIPIIVKGLRNTQDYDYECLLHQIGESQKLGIETFLLPALREKAHLSSTAVKELQCHQGLVHEYVPLYVKQKLEAKISEQYLIGVTGDIGSGKNYVTERLKEQALHEGKEAHHIDLDRVAHDILGTRPEPIYQEVRRQIAQTFGEVQNPDGSIQCKKLGELVFGNPHQLHKLNELMYTPLLVRLRRELHGRQGLIFLDAALLAEANLTHFCNNTIVLVKTDSPSQERRLRERGLWAEQIQRRLESQYRTDEKKNCILEQIAHDRYGLLLEYDNPDGRDDIPDLYARIRDHFHGN